MPDFDFSRKKNVSVIIDIIENIDTYLFDNQKLYPRRCIAQIVTPEVCHNSRRAPVE